MRGFSFPRTKVKVLLPHAPVQLRGKRSERLSQRRHVARELSGRREGLGGERHRGFEPSVRGARGAPGGVPGGGAAIPLQALRHRGPVEGGVVGIRCAVSADLRLQPLQLERRELLGGGRGVGRGGGGGGGGRGARGREGGEGELRGGAAAVELADDAPEVSGRW